jgi:hypothetical protein
MNLGKSIVDGKIWDLKNSWYSTILNEIFRVHHRKIEPQITNLILNIVYNELYAVIQGKSYEIRKSHIA